MTKRRDQIGLGRTPAYVSREIGAAELCISPDTWDEWVRAGLLPPPCKLGASGSTPRWRWADVDAALTGRAQVPEQKPYFSEAVYGKAKDRGRTAA
jgi:hypothetical protein